MDRHFIGRLFLCILNTAFDVLVTCMQLMEKIRSTTRQQQQQVR